MRVFSSQARANREFLDDRIDEGEVVRIIPPFDYGVQLFTRWRGEQYSTFNPYDKELDTSYARLRCLKRAKWSFWHDMKHKDPEYADSFPPPKL